ncbi:GNAT family N-acetyltransferase [Nocardioides panacisoli]|uniref:GNAT family N-acetyltransferase n=1 Tax=Nocardioides panacisoli TaxID=627624 RepID=UPI001C62A689|nr:GNAT family N-acetyltransferase [Nocardioides panacisoli]QYJ03291.1 GNAT family N-acetyltransferase [Nocardioides panacisoli]
MSRTTVPLTVDRLAALEAEGLRCAGCLFWELDPVRRRDATDPATCRRLKESWVSEVLREWGSCGRVLLVDGRPVGYIGYAPASFVPGAAGFPTAPVSPDAVVLTTAHVLPPHRRGGLGRLLVQGMARDLAGRGDVRAVEAFATTGRGLSCALPADFLARTGFKTHRPHPLTPRMRMDLRTLAMWRSGVEAALEKLAGVVRPATAPTPQPEGQRVGERMGRVGTNPGTRRTGSRS